MSDRTPAPYGGVPDRAGGATPAIPPEFVGLTLKVGVRSQHDPFDDAFVQSMVGRKADVRAGGADYVSEITKVVKESDYQCELHITVWVPPELTNQWGVLLDSIGEICTASGRQMTSIAVSSETFERATMQQARKHGEAPAQTVREPATYVSPDPEPSIARGKRALARQQRRGKISQRLDGDGWVAPDDEVLDDPARPYATNDSGADTSLFEP
jgi:hypothetical protein